MPAHKLLILLSIPGRNLVCNEVAARAYLRMIVRGKIFTGSGNHMMSS